MVSLAIYVLLHDLLYDRPHSDAYRANLLGLITMKSSNYSYSYQLLIVHYPMHIYLPLAGLFTLFATE